MCQQLMDRLCERMSINVESNVLKPIPSIIIVHFLLLFPDNETCFKAQVVLKYLSLCNGGFAFWGKRELNVCRNSVNSECTSRYSKWFVKKAV